jgi:peptidoglycan/LPS O-acetylase OafA/YrhL
VLPPVAAVLSAWSARADGPDAWLRRQLLGCLALGVAGMVYLALAHTVLQGAPIPVTLLLPYHLPLFAVGLAVAAVSVHREAPGTSSGLPEALAGSPATWVLLVGGLFWLTTTRATGPQVQLEVTTVWPAATLQLLFAATAGVLLVVGRWTPERGVLARVLASSPLGHLARWSYGIFLWHILVLALVREVVDHRVFSGGFWALLLPTLALSALAAEASARWVERPSSRWRDLVRPAAQRRRRGADPARAPVPGS